MHWLCLGGVLWPRSVPRAFASIRSPQFTTHHNASSCPGPFRLQLYYTLVILCSFMFHVHVSVLRALVSFRTLWVPAPPPSAKLTPQINLTQPPHIRSVYYTFEDQSSAVPLDLTLSDVMSPRSLAWEGSRLFLPTLPTLILPASPKEYHPPDKD